MMIHCHHKCVMQGRIQEFIWAKENEASEN